MHYVYVCQFLVTICYNIFPNVLEYALWNKWLLQIANIVFHSLSGRLDILLSSLFLRRGIDQTSQSSMSGPEQCKSYSILHVQHASQSCQLMLRYVMSILWVKSWVRWIGLTCLLDWVFSSLVWICSLNYKHVVLIPACRPLSVPARKAGLFHVALQLVRCGLPARSGYKSSGIYIFNLHTVI